MEWAGHGPAALRDGWRVTYRAPKLFLGMALAALTLLGVGAGVFFAAIAGVGNSSGARLLFVAAMLGAAVLAVLLYGAVIVGASDALAGQRVSLRRGMRATVSQLPAVIIWGVLTSLVHSVLSTRPAGSSSPFFVTWGVPDLLALAFDALTFLVLPALLLNAGPRRWRRAFSVSGRAFVSSLIAALVLRLVLFGVTFAIIGSQVSLSGANSLLGLAVAFSVIAGVVIFVVVSTWSLATRVALYRRFEETEPSVVPPISGIAGALN